MAQSTDEYIQLPADSTGKKVRSFLQTIGANNVEHQAFVLCDRNGNIIGARQYGPLRVSAEDKTLFLDTHDVALDTTNRWNAGTGTNAPSVSSSVLTFGTTTTVSIYGKLNTQPTFGPIIPGFLQISFALNLSTAAGTERTGGHRFWGQGTSPTTPATTSAATKLTDAIGFEVDTDGKMYAVVYANGSRTAVDLSSSGTGDAASKQPLDGAYHRYIVQIRTDRIYWFIDGLDTPVATQSFVTPTTQTLPILLQTINPGSGVAGGGYPLLVQGTVAADTASNHTQIGDGTYPWRKAQVGKSGGLSVRGATITGTSGGIAAAGTGTVGPLDVSEAGNVTFTAKNTVAASAWAGAPVLVFEQSDDNVSWGPLQVVRADTQAIGSTFTLGVNTANGELMFDAPTEGVNYVRCRVTTGPTTNGMTIVIQPGGMPFSPIVAATLNPAIGGGWATSRLLSAATTNATLVKSSPGQVGGWYVFNSAASTKYLKFYNSASSPTAGSGTPKLTIPIPGTAAANVEFTAGIEFSAGIGFTITGAVADNDTTALAANDVVLNLLYK